MAQPNAFTPKHLILKIFAPKRHRHPPMFWPARYTESLLF